MKCMQCNQVSIVWGKNRISNYGHKLLSIFTLKIFLLVSSFTLGKETVISKHLETPSNLWTSLAKSFLTSYSSAVHNSHFVLSAFGWTRNNVGMVGHTWSHTLWLISKSYCLRPYLLPRVLLSISFQSTTQRTTRTSANYPANYWLKVMISIQLRCGACTQNSYRPDSPQLAYWTTCRNISGSSEV